MTNHKKTSWQVLCKLCLILCVMFILSECYVKKNKLQVQTEATIESEVSESEALVIEGMDYIAERGLKLDITYPILQKDNIEGIFIGTYMVNSVKLGNGLGEKGEGAYIVVNIIDWPSLYKDTNIKSLDFTAYNASCIFDDYDINENKYAKKQMKIKGESKTVYGNDEDKLKLIILNEFPMSDQISHNYMQPGDIEIQRAIDDINKIIVKVDVHYIDGAENTDYYRMESTSDYNINRIDIYKL